MGLMMRHKKTDRNMKYKPWKKLVPFQVPPEAKASNVVAVFQNNHATIFIKETESPGFITSDGSPQKIAHLMINWTKGLKGSDDYFYGLKQRIKRELCGEQSEAVELFPADWREQKFGQTHIWAMLQGATFPIGILPTDIDRAMSDMAGGRENVILKEDLELFVVNHIGGITEVFESEDECKRMYGDKNIPDDSSYGIEIIGNIPLESNNVAWTDSAKAKLANVMAKGEAAASTGINHETPDLFNEQDTIEDEIFDESISDDDGDDGDPVGLEEEIALADAMKEALGSKADERARRVREVTESVIGRSEENINAVRKSLNKSKIIVP
jgi:hypothetical protein